MATLTELFIPAYFTCIIFLSYQDVINIKLVQSKIKEYIGFTPITKDELKKANYGREFLPSGVASASNAVPFDLNVDLGAYTSLDGDIDFPMFGVEGDPSGSIIRPQMQVGPGTDGGANPNETTNNDDPNANNSGDPSNNEEIITTESVTTTSPFSPAKPL